MELCLWCVGRCPTGLWFLLWHPLLIPLEMGAEPEGSFLCWWSRAASARSPRGFGMCCLWSWWLWLSSCRAPWCPWSWVRWLCPECSRR